MRKLYVAIMAAAAIGAFQAVRIGRYGNRDAEWIFVVCVIVFAVFAAVALLDAKRSRIREFYPFRMMRLWAKVKEAELKKRAGES